MSVLVIYHAGCWDGFCAAWLFSKAFPDAEFHAAHYGTEPPDVCGKEVYLVDFSYKRDVMAGVIGQAHKVCVLDHHKTAQQELTFPSCSASEFLSPNGRIHIHFDMEKSGGRLAWEFLYGNRLLPDDWLTTNRSGYSLGVAPWLVDYTEDRDLWKWQLPDSREVNAALRSYPLDFCVWDSLRIRKLHGLIDQGSAILRRERQIIDDHLRHAREITLAGHAVKAVNATVMFSDIAGELAKGRPFGACYFDRHDGKRVWSLRSTPEGVDVSEVAKLFGGGGHRHAAGFETDIIV